MAQDGTNDLFVGGDFTTYNGTGANHLIRLHPNGTIAQTFGQGFDEVVLFLGLTTDGSNALYAGGPFSQFDSQPVPPLVRLTRTGSLDPGFRFIANFSPGLTALAEDGSGDLYTVFVTPSPPDNTNPAGNPGDTSRLHIARLNPDGSIDPAFSTGGGFVSGSPSKAIPASIAALLGASNGKLYVGGSLFSYDGVPVSSLLRLNANGTLDSTFVAQVGVIGGANVVETIVSAHDGTLDIYAGGRIGSYNGTKVNFSIRVAETSALDTTYTQAVSLVPNVISPAQDGTGDVFLSGFSSINGSIVFRLLRLDRTGALVSTFHEPTLENTYILSIIPVLDGTRDLYIGGVFTTYNGVPVNHIARIHADGSLASVVN